MNGRMNVTEPEIKLWNNKKEQEKYENLAELFAILKTTDKLERAYVRDSISPKEYEPCCAKLIAQYKTLYQTLKDEVPDVRVFMSTYNMQCPMAALRLLDSGIPATIEHGKGSGYGDSSAKVVGETVQFFITTMDSLKLGMVAVDQVGQLSSDFPPKMKIKDWMTKLHNMGASDELDESAQRQLLFDLESAYNEFMTAV